MNRRLETIKFTILHHTFGGDFSTWLLNVFAPPLGMMKNSIVKEVVDDGDYYQIYLKNYDTPIFLSKSISLQNFYRSAVEQYYKWHWHYYQVPETTVTKDDVVFDCGCAEGIFPFIAKDHAKKIYAFEPVKEFVKGLHRTFDENTNVKIVESALGKVPGTGYMKSAGAESSISDVKTDFPIRIETLDEFCSMNRVPLNYLKADLEGYEMEMLLGGAEAIREFKPKIAITTYHRSEDAVEIRKYLQKLVPDYHFRIKGITHFEGAPVMLHAWV
jgi:FkbM family methyltransferase